MGEKITTMVTTAVILLVFMLLISFIATDTKIDQSVKLVESFTELVQYKGYVTLDQYNELIAKIPFKNIKINMTHTLRDVNNEFTSGTRDMVFTTQMMGSPDTPNTLLCVTGKPEEQKIYYMKIGDQFKVDLILQSPTLFDMMSSAILGESAGPSKMLTSCSGVILNQKYEEPKSDV